MGKKALTIDLSTGVKKLETIIIDSEELNNAKESDDQTTLNELLNREDITFSGKYINDNLISVAHESNIIGEKTLDETNIQDSYVLKYNSTTDKIEYTKTEDTITTIDCGYF